MIPSCFPRIFPFNFSVRILIVHSFSWLCRFPEITKTLTLSFVKRYTISTIKKGGLRSTTPPSNDLHYNTFVNLFQNATFCCRPSHEGRGLKILLLLCCVAEALCRPPHEGTMD